MLIFDRFCLRLPLPTPKVRGKDREEEGREEGMETMVRETL